MKLELLDSDVITRAVNKRLASIRGELKPALEEVKGEIVTRTQSGQSVTGGKFKDYSKQWGAVRKAAGRPLSPPDLTFTGRMLSSMRVRVGGNIGEIFFGNEREARKAAENQRLRAFFGWSKNAVELLVGRLRKVK